MAAGIRCDSAGSALLVRVLTAPCRQHKSPRELRGLGQIGGLLPHALSLAARGVWLFTSCGLVCFVLSGVWFLSVVVLAWQGLGGVMWLTAGSWWFVARLYGVRLRGDCSAELVLPCDWFIGCFSVW